MKYNYCPACDNLRPKTFMLGDRCEKCGGDALNIEVKRSAYGYAMYVADLIAAVMLVFFVAHRNFDAPFASFMVDVNNDLFLVILFGLIFLSFALAFIDVGKTNRKAREIVDQRKEHIKG